MRAEPSIVAVMILLSGGTAAQTAPPTPSPASEMPPQVMELPPVEVVGVSPLIGSGIDRNTVPAETQVLDSADLTREGTPNL